MVEYGSGPVKESIDNAVFIVPGLIIGSLFLFFAYKLVSSLKEKERQKDEKKKMKLQRKDKEMKKKKR